MTTKTSSKNASGKKIGRLPPRTRELLVLCDDVTSSAPDSYLSIPVYDSGNRRVPSLGREVMAVGGVGDVDMFRDLKKKGLVDLLMGKQTAEVRVTESGHELVQQWRENNDLP